MARRRCRRSPNLRPGGRRGGGRWWPRRRPGLALTDRRHHAATALVRRCLRLTGGEAAVEARETIRERLDDTRRRAGAGGEIERARHDPPGGGQVTDAMLVEFCELFPRPRVERGRGGRPLPQRARGGP